MPTIRFDEDGCGNLDSAMSHEWLETNGLGGFASSTIVGLNTRRYHGPAGRGRQAPVGQLVLLSKLDSSYHQGTVWPWLMGPFVSPKLQHGQRLNREALMCT
jgi:glycogen debranching enzyme